MGLGKIGCDWTFTVYFDPMADQDSGQSYIINDDELKDTLSPHLKDDDGHIKKVTVYKHPLFCWQITDFLLYHNFVLLETNKWQWTIEKNSQGITIQRSEHLDAVKDRYRQTNRDTRIKEVIHDVGRTNIDGLINWLCEEDELKNTYNYLRRNCQHFAKAVFNYVANEKNMK